MMMSTAMMTSFVVNSGILITVVSSVVIVGGSIVTRHYFIDMSKEFADNDPAAKFMKSFSMISAKTLGHLDQLEAALQQVEREVTDTEQDLISGEISIGKAKDVLAQIEARLDKLQFNGIDSVETVHLHSGKEPAKAARKELVRQAEDLSVRIDKIFKQIKEAEKSN
mmetsp:Transcript_4963/g.5553  ORF Transcript_4963/g.5553 Transcript_4963/m.5553 type:complete len:167 (-) Transcript_4963:92-592(-)